MSGCDRYDLTAKNAKAAKISNPDIGGSDCFYQLPAFAFFVRFAVSTLNLLSGLFLLPQLPAFAVSALLTPRSDPQSPTTDLHSKLAHLC